MVAAYYYQQAVLGLNIASEEQTNNPSVESEEKLGVGKLIILQLYYYFLWILDGEGIRGNAAGRQEFWKLTRKPRFVPCMYTGNTLDTLSIPCW